MPRFHSHTHISAEGTPELTDAPAPTKTQTGEDRLTPIDLTRASIGRIKSSSRSSITASLSDWAILETKTLSPVQVLQPVATAAKSKKWAPPATDAPLVTLACNQLLDWLCCSHEILQNPFRDRPHSQSHLLHPHQVRQSHVLCIESPMQLHDVIRFGHEPGK